MDHPRRLLSFEYIGLLGIILLVFCNIAVFYNLYNYLGVLGISGDLRGLLVGVFSLISMPLFLFVSPFINHRNAPQLMLVGLFALAACGVAYLFVDSFPGMLVLRCLNGAAMFCLSASSLALLVWVIPEEKSGQGFAIYSSAILIPYALVPMVVDALEPWIDSPAQAYAVMAGLLIPAAAVVLVIMKRLGKREIGEKKPRLPSWAAIRGNITRRPVAVMLAAQCFLFHEFLGPVFFVQRVRPNYRPWQRGLFFSAYRCS